MKLSKFGYYLPKNLIAQRPIRPRDHSRLLVIRRPGATGAHSNAKRNQTSKIEHKYFYNIVDYLQAGDVLVLNNSKVFPARLIGKKKKTGGKIEVFLTSPPTPLLIRRGEFKGRGKGVWQCLLGGHGRKEGLEIEFSQGLKCKIIKDNKDGTWDVRFNLGRKAMMNIVNKIGHTPLPPYIKRNKRNRIPNRVYDSLSYQTVYADDKKVGSVAAPTAGFHFTPRLIKKLKKKGVQFEYITLHVGLGTFAPVKTNDVTKHKMHAEFVEIKKDVIQRIVKAKKEKRRIIAVGTTSVRTLEAVWNNKEAPQPFKTMEPSGDSRDCFANARNDNGFSGWVDIFIYPGYKFKIVDGMITNFHLPKSTLLMLVMAFAGGDNILKAYRSAIDKKYRFYSYGDAMLIL